MFERFTDRARRAVVEAQAEARMLNHNYIGTEHILMGLLSIGEGIGAQVLHGLGIGIDGVREYVVTHIGRGQTPPTGHIPFTPRGKKVLELALREALKMGHNYIGTEHILLALTREGEGVAASILVERGIHPDILREKVIEALSGRLDVLVASGGTATARLRETVEGGREPRVPSCPSCRAPMSESASYKILDVPEQENREHTARVLFLYCTSCGATIDTLIAPEDN